MTFNRLYLPAMVLAVILPTILLITKPIDSATAVHTGIVTDATVIIRGESMAHMIRVKGTNLSSNPIDCTSDKPFLLFISANNTTGQDRNITVNDGTNEVKYDLKSKTGLSITVGDDGGNTFTIQSSNNAVEMFITLETSPLASAGCTT